MLSALLTSLGTQLFSASYAGSVLLPLFLTLMLNLTIARWADSSSVASWLPAGGWFTATGTLSAAEALLSFLGAAYLLSSLQGWMLELLEGKHLTWLLRDELRDEHRRRRQMTKDLLQGAAELAKLHNLERDATGTNDDAPALETLRQGGSPLTAEQITAANLDEETFTVYRNYALDYWKHELTLLETRRDFTFPGNTVRVDGYGIGENMLAPTEFGNIGRTMRSYALTRYNMDLDVFWSRLQRSIVSVGQNDKFSDNLTATKARLDFAVAMTYLTPATALFWSFYLALQNGRHMVAPVVVAAAGSYICYAFYRLACYNYVVFADMMRAAVDCYRFLLLKDLHVVLPTGSAEEEGIWGQLGSRTGQSNNPYITYKHP